MGKVIGLTFPEEEAVKMPPLSEEKEEKREETPKKTRKAKD